jgi:hypothetical protein
MPEQDSRRFEKLTRDNVEDTRIMAGHSSFTVQQLENEIDANTEIGKKLKTIEKELEKY